MSNAARKRYYREAARDTRRRSFRIHEWAAPCTDVAANIRRLRDYLRLHDEAMTSLHLPAGVLCPGAAHFGGSKAEAEALTPRSSAPRRG